MVAVRSVQDQEDIEDLRQSDRSGNADDWCQSQYQPYHDAGEVTSKNRVNDDEDVLIFQVAEAKVNTGGEKPHKHIQVEEECWPSGWLMFGYRGNDGDVNLRVGGIPKRVETTGPRCNDA